MLAFSKKTFSHLIIIAILFSLTLVACGAAPTPLAGYEADGYTGYDKNMGAALPEAPAEEYMEREVASEPAAVPDVTGQPVERMVIHNANLSISVADPPQSMDAVSQMAEEMDGYVVSANLYHTTLESGVRVPRASITIRVPSERLNEALGRIKEESDQDPLSESIDSQDITSDYVDLQSRLRNLEKAEAQLTEIMESAEETEDVLSVYNELVRVQEQIELIKGQMKYYEESARLSSISTEIIADAAIQPLTIGGWQPVGVAKDALQALINTLKFLANAAIWIGIYILPVLLVLYLVFFLPLSLVWRAWRKRRSQKKLVNAKQPPAKAPEEKK